MDRIEALAESMASQDGKISSFRNGKIAKSETAFGVHYAGYMAEAKDLIIRLNNRGHTVTKKRVR